MWGRGVVEGVVMGEERGVAESETMGCVGSVRCGDGVGLRGT